jgi:two-component system sensor histidine kinase/response regulator
MKTALPKESVMIVDDNPENLNVLSKMLDGQGWDVRVFPRGDLALYAALTQPPDLVLMDVLMPGLDGYATCRGFKQNIQLKDVPIIFLSALTDSQDKARAFEAGGVDYVTKPFYEAEVLARVRVQLALRRHQTFLEDLVLRRTGELMESQRRLRIWDSAKDQWLNLLSHEMRTPLTGVIGITELLFSDLPPESDIHDLRNGYDLSVRRINKLIDDALLLTQIDVSSEKFMVRHAKWIDVYTQLQSVANRHLPHADIQWQADSGDKAVEIKIEPELFQRAFLDLLSTAEHCVHSGEAILVESCSSESWLKVTISTNGQSLPPSDLDTFFGVCGQRTLLKGGGDFGLAPVLAERIFNLFDGECFVRNGVSCGIVIEIRLPISENSDVV